MLFGQYRISPLTLPTVAAFSVISILWFRHHQKRRRLLVDQNTFEGSKCSFTEEDCTDSEEDIEVSTIPTTPEAASFVEEEAAQENLKESELTLREPFKEDIAEEISDSVDIKKEAPSPLTMSIEENSKKIIESSGKPTVMATETELICSKKKDIENSLDELSDLEEGEIRSPDNSFSVKGNPRGAVSKEDSEERDSVFADDSEDSDKCKQVALEDMESDLEEGEVRSTDGRTEDTMQEELSEKLASLKLEQLKKTGDSKELPSLELERMKLDDGKSGSERDSANHSPSEVMLASPSISNFSDAHSEGSSDSGKGQSDAALSPSRTPARGSSIAGDNAISLYEFVLPQIIVGRLIGRHGTFLHEIKTQTHTNIFIKRHPDSHKLKICAIEGTQQDIDKALAKIRQKFPLRRFPQLTLEKVSFVQLNPLPPLKPEDFHLQLIEGVNNDVILSSLLSAAHFFLQQPCHPSYNSLTALNSIMGQLYSAGEAPPLQTPVTYAVCAAPAMGGWYRAQIIHVDEDGQTCTVRYLDYGGYSTLPAGDLRQIRGDLLALPFQAVECYLANVLPLPGEDEWSEEARSFVHSLTVGQVLQAQVYDYAEDGAPLVYLYSKFGSQVVLINEELVLHGYGVMAESCSGSCGTASEDGGRTDEELSLDKPLQPLPATASVSS